jgi:hypothetical protein
MATPAWPEELFGPPEGPVPEIDWADVRAQTGLEFPPDYKEFAGLYPALIIDDVLILWHPAGPPGFNLFEPPGPFDLWQSWDPPEEIIEFDPVTGESRMLDRLTPGRLFPWGRSATNDVIGFWLVDDDPSKWTVVLFGGEYTQWRYRGSLTEFLPDLLSGRVTCPLLPGDWPDFETEREVQQLFG